MNSTREVAAGSGSLDHFVGQFSAWVEKVEEEAANCAAERGICWLTPRIRLPKGCLHPLVSRFWRHLPVSGGMAECQY